MQGYFSGVWGVAAIVGPAIGGLITSTVGWPWVFELNIPVGLLAAAIIGFGLHERFERRPHRVDWSGAALLSGSVVLLLFAVSEGGQLFGWVSVPFAAMLGGAAALLAVRAPRTPCRRSRSWTSTCCRFPLIRAGLLDRDAGRDRHVRPDDLRAAARPGRAGRDGGRGRRRRGGDVDRLARRLGHRRADAPPRRRPPVRARPAALLDPGRLAGHHAGHAGSTRSRSPPRPARVVGLGMGFSSTVLLIMIQGAVPWQRRATATGLVQFSRTIGGSVGVGVMGGILAAFVGHGVLGDPRPDRARAAHGATQLAAGRDALESGLQVVYWLMAAAAAAACVVAIRTMPAARLGDGAAALTPADVGAGGAPPAARARRHGSQPGTERLSPAGRGRIAGPVPRLAPDLDQAVPEHVVRPPDLGVDDAAAGVLDDAGHRNVHLVRRVLGLLADAVRERGDVLGVGGRLDHVGDRWRRERHGPTVRRAPELVRHVAAAAAAGRLDARGSGSGGPCRW